MKHDRAAVIAIIREKRAIEEKVREEARKAIETVDVSMLMTDPERTLKTYFAAQGMRILRVHEAAARKAGERFVQKVE
jgi:hypothetical protein